LPIATLIWRLVIKLRDTKRRGCLYSANPTSEALVNRSKKISNQLAHVGGILWKYKHLRHNTPVCI